MELFFILIAIPAALVVTFLVGLATGIRGAVPLGVTALVVMILFAWIANVLYKRSSPKMSPSRDDVRSFQLGSFGHTLLLGGGFALSWWAFHLSRQHAFVPMACAGMLAIGCVIILVMHSPFSPLFVGPALVATPEGIKVRRFLIPWQEIQAVGPGAGRGNAVSIVTRQPLRNYSTVPTKQYGDAGTQISVLPFGTSQGLMIRYLRSRVELSEAKASAALAEPTAKAVA